MSEGMSERTQVKEGLSASDGCNSGTCAAGTALSRRPPIPLTFNCCTHQRETGA